MKSSKPWLCIFSEVLGGKTFSARLLEALRTIDGLPLELLRYGSKECYLAYPSPWFLKWSNTLEAIWRVRSMYGDRFNSRQEFQGIIFQSYNLIPPFHQLIKKIPSIVALDTTPVLANRLVALERGTKVEFIKRASYEVALRYLFDKTFKEVDMFLARTEWCAHSLRTDYGVPSEKIRVTYCPLDLERWRPPMRKITRKKKRLLFVGNDFQRKGGPFLIEVFTKWLAEKCVLQIVSNDPQIRNMTLPEGVEVYSGLGHDNVNDLIEIYQNSDVFVFPTRRDQLGLVLCEAIAVGLPIVATNIGGVSELVIDQYNGRLMPYAVASHNRHSLWAHAILDLIDSEERLERYGANSRCLALAKLDPEKFRLLVGEAIRVAKAYPPFPELETTSTK